MITTFRKHRRVIGYGMIGLMSVWQVAQPLQGATVNWTAGSAADFNWNNAANWDLGVPLAADDLVFGNPIPNPGFLSSPEIISLSGGSVANSLRLRDNYALSGGDLALTSGVINADLGSSSVIGSQLIGSGGLTLNGGGMVRLANALNSYTGQTIINNGTLVISNPGALGADTSPVVVNGTVTRSGGGGSLLLEGNYTGGMNFTRNLTLQGFGPTGDRHGALTSVRDNTVSGLITANVGLLSTRITSSNGALTLAGGIDVGGTAATHFVVLGGTNQAGSNSVLLTGPLTGTGTLERSGIGALFLQPSSSSGFSGTVRMSSSPTGGQSSVRISTANVLGTRTATNTGGVLDFNGGILEVLMDAPSVLAGGAPANVYQRATSTLFVDHAAGSTASGGTLTLGQFAFEENFTFTFNARNGYNITFGAATVQGGNNTSTLTNNLAGGTLTFTGNFWSNSDSTGSRTMAIGGNGNTTIAGNVIAANTTAGIDHSITKTGTGVLNITSVGATLDGNVNVNGGTVQIADFRSINMHSATSTNNGVIRIGTSGTAGTLNIGNATAATAAGLTTNKVINLSGSTGGATINANQTFLAPVILNGNIDPTQGGAKSLTLGGTSTQDNRVNGIISAGTATTSLVKTGPGTWVLAGVNTYAGTTTISEGLLKLQANAAASNIIVNTSSINFGANATVQSAGGTLQFIGANSVATTEALGQLIPAAGAGTIILTSGGGGAAANLTFASLGTVNGTSGINFVTGGSGGGVVTLTGQAATTATTLPGSGHLYINGADFARINASAQVVTPVYGTDAGFVLAPAALTASTHNLVTGSFATAAPLTISSLKMTGHTLTLGGNLTVSTGGILQAGGSSVIDGAGLILGSAAGTNIVIRVDGVSDVLTLASGVNIGSAQTGGLTKNGAGTLIIEGVNAQTGTTAINEGTVKLSGSGRLAATAGVATTLRQGATLDLNGLTTQTAIANFDGAGTVTNTNAAAGTLVITGAGTFSGIIQDGAGVVNVSKLGTTGAPTWTGQSTYTGVTTIGGSTGLVSIPTIANIGVASPIGRGNTGANAGSLVFQATGVGGLNYTGVTAGVTDRLFTFDSNTVGGGAQIANASAVSAPLNFTNTGALAFGPNATVAQTLTLGGASTADNFFGPQVSDNGLLKTSVSKIGAGTWVLGNAANTYSGTTTVGQGILIATDGAGLPAASGLLLGATTNAGIFQTTGTFTRNLSTVGAAGLNTVSWNGTTGGGGFASHGGKLVVAIGGTGSPTPLQWTTGGFVPDGAALIFGSATAVGEVEFRNSIDLNGLVRTITVNDNGQTAADFASITGIISDTLGTGGLVKNGTGQLQLFGANTYVGTTGISEGTLIVTSLGSSASPGASSVGDSTAGNATTGAVLLGNGTTAAGILDYVGSGEISDRMIRINTTTASNQIHANGSGPLVLTNVDNTMASGAKTLFLRGTNAAGNMITSSLADNGGTLGVTVDGSATWILSGASTFTGSVTASAGSLGIGNNSALGAGTLILSNSSIFAHGGDRTIANPITHSNNTTPAFYGDYSITFTNTYANASAANSNSIVNNLAPGKLLTFGAITNNSITAARSLTFSGSGDWNITGPLTNSTAFNLNPVFSGSGTMTLGASGSSLWNQVTAGTFTINSGTIRVGADEVIPNGAGPGANGNVVISPAVGVTATLDLNGRTETINGLTATSAGNVVINNTSATDASFIFGDNEQAVAFGGGTGTYTITDTGTGKLSITKVGSTTVTFPSSVVLSHEGSTSVTGGSFIINAPVNGTTGLSATGVGSLLALTGGITNPTALTSMTVSGGATLVLWDNVGSNFNSLTSLNLGAGAGIASLGLDVGASTALSDRIVLAGAPTLANTIQLNLKALTGFGSSLTYDLISASAGLDAAAYTLGFMPGGFSYNLNTSATLVQLGVTPIAAGDLYWSGDLGNAWASLNGANSNFSTDSLGTIDPGGSPGPQNTVIFSSSLALGPTVTTALENSYTINALKFTANPPGVSAVNVTPGAVPSNSLTVAPALSTDGIDVAGSSGAVTISAPFIIGANQTWSVDGTGGAALILNGGVSGTGNLTVNATNGGVVTLGGTTPGSYLGTTSISTGAILQGGAANTFSPASAYTVATGATLRLNGFNNAIGSLAGSGTVHNNGTAAATLTVGADNSSTTFSGLMANGGSGTFGLTKVGTGMMTLVTNNTYTGSTILNNGTIRYGIDNALAASALTIMNAPANGMSPVLFDLNGNDWTSAAVTFYGTASDATSQADLNIGTGGTLTLGGNVTLTVNATAANGFLPANILGGTLSLNAARTFAIADSINAPVDLTVTSIISSTGAFGPTKTGAGTLLFTGANTYTGATVVNGAGGTLRVSGAGTLGNGSAPLTMTAGTLDLGGTNQSVGLLTGAAAGTILNGSAATTSTLTIGTGSLNTAIGTYAGTIVDGAGFVSLVKAGAGIISLTGANSYTGGTQVNDGVLVYGTTASQPATGTTNVGPTAALGLGVGGAGFYSQSDVDSLFANTMLNVSLAATSGVGIDTTAGDFTYSTDQSASRALIKLGTNVLSLTGNNSYTGGTTVAAGSLSFTSDSNLGAPAGAVTILAGATLRAAGTSNVVTSRTFTLPGTSNFEVSDAANNFTIASNLTPGGILTKVGPGGMTLNGNYTSTTNIVVNGGRFSINGGTVATGAGSLSVAAIAGSRGQMFIESASNVTATSVFLGGNGTGSGALTVRGGTLTSTAADATNAGIVVGNAAVAHGIMRVEGGVVNANRLTIAGNGFGAASGVFEQTGGVVNIATWVIPTQSGSTNALFDISGGTFNAGTNFASSHGSGNYAVMNVRGTGTLSKNGTAISLLNNNTSNSNNITILNVLTGGTIATPAGGIVMANATSGVNNLGIVNFDGGTLKPNFHSPTLVGFTMTGLNAASGAYVNAGGLNVDSNGYDSVIPTPLQAVTGVGVQTIAVTSGGSGYVGAPHIKISGGGGVGATAIANMVDDGTGNGTFKIGSITITSPGTGYNPLDNLTVSMGDTTSTYTTRATLGAVTFNAGNVSGGVTKSGLGNLTLSGNNTFTGPITVTGGRLILTGTNATNNVVIEGGALSIAPIALPNVNTFNVGATTSGTLDLLADGIAAPWNIGSGKTINLGGLTSTGSLGFNLGSNTSTSDRMIFAPGSSLVVNAGGGFISGTALAGFAVGNSYDVISGATISGSGTFQAGTLPSGFRYSVNTVGGTVTLNVTDVAPAGDLFWKGGVNTAWGGLAGNTSNWSSTADGASVTDYGPGANNFVTFSSTSVNVPTGMTLESPVSVQGMRFLATTTPSVTITQGAAGSLTLGSQGIDIQAGAQPATLISAPVVIGSPQTWIADAGMGSTLAFDGIVSGGPGNSTQATPGANTALTIKGAGSVSFGNTGNTFTGDIVVDGGGLNVDNDRDWGGPTVASSTSKTVTLINGGRLNVSSGTVNPGAASTTNYNLIRVGSGGGTFNVAAGATLQLDDAGQFGIAPGSTLTKTGTGLLILGSDYGVDIGAGSSLVATGGSVRLQANVGALGTTDKAALTLNGADLDLRLNGGGVFGNNVNVLANTTITTGRTTAAATDITMTMGDLSLAGVTLTSANGANNTAPAVANLAFGATTITGSPTFNVTNVNGAGVGTLTLASVLESGGSYSLTKTGAGNMVIGGDAAFTGSTTVSGGRLSIFGDVGTTGSISVTGTGSALALLGGVTSPTSIANLTVGGGSSLNLVNSGGTQLALDNLTLGSSGGTSTTLSLDVGDLLTAGDMGATDILGLKLAGSLNLFAGNNVVFDLSDAGLRANQTYNLVTAPGGGLITGALGAGNWILGGAPGGFSTITINKTDNIISITTGNLLSGTLYWRGLTNNAWNANVNNWSSDKAGSLVAASIPGAGNDVVFQSDALPGGTQTTTLEQNFRVNSLTFESSAATPSVVNVNPGANTSARLDVAPGVSTAGITLSAGSPPTVNIGASVKLGANQTWTVADATARLTVTGALTGTGALTKEGAGRVVVSNAADSAFAVPSVTINQGDFEIGNGNALGSALLGNAATVNVNAGTRFYLNNATTQNAANPIVLNGGTLTVGSATQTYSGPISVPVASTVNLVDPLQVTPTARQINLEGAISGAAKLIVDSVTTVTTGNQLTGTLALNGASPTWTGGVDLMRGTITTNKANGLGTGDVNVPAGFGRITWQGTNGANYTISNNINIVNAGGHAMLEMGVDNVSGAVTSPFTASFTGTLTLGGAAGAGEARVFLADVANSVAVFDGPIVINSATGYMAVAGNAAARAVVNSVISEVNPGTTFWANNNSASGTSWGATLGILRLNAANTFTGDFNMSGGTVEYSTVNSVGGPASNLGMGTNINMGGGTLAYIGSVPASTDRPIALTAGSTLRTAGTTNAATITYTGAVTAGANAITLTGVDNTYQGFISGGITQTGTAADLTVVSGTWNLTGTNVFADDVIVGTVAGNASILNLNSTGVLAYTSGTSNGLYARFGSTINLNAPDVTGVNNSGSNDFILISDNSSGGVLNTNTFNITTARLDLGQATAGFSGSVVGTGSVTATTNINLYQGNIVANLAGAGAILKAFGGTVTVSGNNSGLTGTTAARVDAGELILDYTTSNTTKLRALTGLDMRGGTLTLNGSASEPTSQTVASLTLASGGSNRINLNPGVGQPIVLSLGGITRAANAGTLRINLPTGVQDATNGVITTAALTNGALGGFLTVSDGTGIYFATKNGTNNIVPLISTISNDVSTWATNDNVTDDAGGYTGTTGSRVVNTIRFNSSPGSVVNVGTVIDQLDISSGSILVTPAVTSGTPGIFGGTINSGITDVVVTQDSSQMFEIGSAIRNTNALTKTGTGTLRLSGANNFTGSVQIQAGTLEVSGGQGIGDRAAVVLADDQQATLTLLSNETIGNLSGGNATAGFLLGNVNVGANTLTINQTANGTYAGTLTGSGAIVRNGRSGVGNLLFTGTSGAGFTGSLTINGGLVYLETLGTMNASSITVNRGGSFLISNNGTTRSGARLPDNMPMTLNSADGAWNSEVRPSGLAIRTDQAATTNETIGVLTFASGANYFRGDASGTDGITAVIASNFVRSNNATIDARGRNLGGSSGNRSQLRIGDATNQTAFITAMVGGAGAAATTTQSIVPWAFGEITTGTLADANMGNTLLTYTSGQGFRGLDFTTDYVTFGSKAANNENLREVLVADLIGLASSTQNAIVFHNAPADGSNAFVTVGGAGAGTSLAVTAGTMLFTLNPLALASSDNSTTVSGFDSGITVGATNEYVIFVQNPSAALTTPKLSAVISSPLTSAADITKSGRGTLVLTSVNTAGGGARKVTLNEGVLEITDLDNMGGGTGGLVFGGGTLRLSATYSGDDLSTRSISYLIGGGTIDTNGLDLVLAGSAGSGIGGLTKAGLGNLTLNAAATFTGGTTISAGTLTAGANNATGVGGPLTVNGATLDTGAFTLNHSSLTTTGVGSVINGTGTINSAEGFFFGHTGDTSVSPVLSSSQGVVKTEANTVTLTGLNTFTGAIEVQAGVLAFGSIGDVGSGPSAAGNPSSLAESIIRVGLGTVAGGIGYTGPGASSNRAIAAQGTTGGAIVNADGTGAFVLTTGVVGATPGTKTVTLGGNADPTIVNSIAALDQRIAVFSLTKTGAATWALPNANNYSGTTAINQGALRVLNAGSLGTTTNGTTVAAGGALELDGTVTVTGEALTIAGTGVANGGALRGISGANTWVGTVNMSAAAQIAADAGSLTIDPGTGASVTGTNFDLTLSGAGDVIVSRGVSIGTGLLTKTGSGLAVVGASSLASTHGPVTISGGTLRLLGSFPAASTVTIQTGGTLQGAATLGPVVVEGGATLAPGTDGTIGALDLVSLTFSAGAFLKFDIDSSTKTSDTINVVGGLSIVGAPTIAFTELNDIPPLGLNDVITLVTYGSGWSPTDLFTFNGNPLADDSEITIASQKFIFNYNDGVGANQITLTNVSNVAPSDITLAPSSVIENAPANTFVGTVTGSDPNAGQSATLTFALVTGPGDTDNALFNFDGTNLTTAVSFDREVQATRSIRIRATDTGTPPLSYDEVITINITDENEVPTISDIADASTDEDVATAPLAFTLTDPEDVDGLVLSAASSNPTLVPVANISFGGTGANRTLTALPANDQFGTTTITVSAFDGLTTVQDSFVLTVVQKNDVPVFTKGADQVIPLTVTAPQTVTGWATGIDDGDPEVSQALSFNVTVTSDPDSIFTVPPAVDSSGNLTYTLDGVGGTATIDVSLTDDATAGSPAETSAVQTFTISQTAETESKLANLSISSGALSPSFASNTTSYQNTIGPADSSITVTPTMLGGFATIEVRSNGGSFASVASGSASAPLSMNVGANTIDVRVTAQNGSQTTYTITLNRTLVTIADQADVGVANDLLVNPLNVSGTPSGPLVFQLLSNGTNGTATVHSDGTYRYQPNTGFLGNDSFTYQVSDNTGVLGTATVTLAIVLRPPHWSWEGGSNLAKQKRSVSTPGARGNMAAWSDPVNNKLYVFGGTGFTTTAGPGALNDFWVCDLTTQTWTLLGGTDTQDAASTASFPGARAGATAVNDGNGNLWLFGGLSKAGPLNDLWKYNITGNTWTLVKGTTAVKGLGVYGTKGTPATPNIPGARSGAAGWVDCTGKVYVFGGNSMGSTGTAIALMNDLWRYDPLTNNWTWLNGSNLAKQLGVYGTKGVAAAANTPGARTDASAWTGRDGSLWLFGGSNNNDLWKYDPSSNAWAWISGQQKAGFAGVYKVVGLPDAATEPASRGGARTWVDADGALVLFGGLGAGLRDDVWSYQPATGVWTWLKGSRTAAAKPLYGTLHVGAEPNTPGARQQSALGMDAEGNLWSFGGINGNNSYNDLFKLDVPEVMQLATLAATTITDTTAILNATVDPNSISTSAYIRYGTLADMSNAVNLPATDVGNGTVAVAVSPSVGSLTPGTTYYYQVVGINAFGTRTGALRCFTTTGVAPAASIQFAATGSSVDEGVGVANVVIALSAPATTALDVPVTIGLASTASAADYTSPVTPVKFAVGQSTANVSIPITNDTAAEGTETIVFNFGALPGGLILGGNPSHTLSITDNDAAISITTAPTDQFIALKETLTLAVVATGPAGLKYQWKKGGKAIKGATSPTYIVHNATTALAGDYVCDITGPAGITPTASVKVFVLDATAKLLTVAAGKPASFVVNATGPAGTVFSYQWKRDGVTNVGINSKTFSLPAAAVGDAGTYTCTVSATGSLATVMKNGGVNTLRVATPVVYPANLVGSYIGLAGRNTALAGNLGARVDLTTTATGGFTAAVTSEGLTGAKFIGTMIPVFTGPNVTGATGRAEYTRAGRATLRLEFTLDATANLLTGTITDINTLVSEAVNGYRNVWAVAKNAGTYAGQYNYGLEIPVSAEGDIDIPQGNGFGSYTVAVDGKLTLAGQTADGLAYSSAGFVGPAAVANGPVSVIVYSAFKAPGGSLLGTTTVTPAGVGFVNSTYTGNLSWNRAAEPSTSKGVTYRNGFQPISLSIVGGKYKAPAAGQVIAGLINADNRARLAFSSGGLNTGDLTPNPFVFSIRNTGTAVAQTVKLPVVNTNKVTFKLASKPLGQYSGTFTIPNAVTTLVRTAKFNGIVVWTGSAYVNPGYFLLAQPPQSGTTVSTSPILSGQVVLEPQP